MELAYKERLEKLCKTNLAHADEDEIRFLYHAVFGEVFKKNCGQCIDDAFYKLLKHARANKMIKTTGKYRFTKEWEKKKVVVSVLGSMVTVTAETLSIAMAEVILNSGKYRQGIVELNPDYNGAEETAKKNELIGQEEPLPILSISPEAVTDGNISAENVSAKESNTKGSKPLTEKKKGRGGK